MRSLGAIIIICTLSLLGMTDLLDQMHPEYQAMLEDPGTFQDSPYQREFKPFFINEYPPLSSLNLPKGQRQLTPEHQAIALKFNSALLAHAH